MCAALPYEIDVVVVNGCESTSGSALADPELAWPKILANELGARLVDFSAPGGSNHRLVRTTLGRLPETVDERSDPSRVLFVGMWTHPERYEVVRGRSARSQSPWRRIDEQPWHAITPELAGSGDRPSQAWLRIYRPLFGVAEVYLWALLLERWLTELGCRSLQCAAVDVASDVADSFPEYRAQMRSDAYLGGADRWLVESLGSTGRHLPGGGDMPDEAAHRAFALDRVIPWLARSPESPRRLGCHAPTGPVRAVVANGDSNTFGTEHSQPARTNWAAVLADRLDAELVNLATPGGSNHRLLRTTVEHLPRILHERGLAPHEVLFAGLWTYPQRFEVIGDEQRQVNVHDPGFTDRYWNRIGPYQLKHRHESATVWYEHLEDSRAGLVDFLTSTILFDRWLGAAGCRYALAMAFDILPARDGEIGALARQVRPDSCVGGTLWSRRSMYALCGPKGLAPGGHLREESHQEYVDEHLLPWLRASGQLG